LVISEGLGDGWLRRRGFWLEYASVAWMIVEAAAAITAGIIASSIALTGFGLDSVIELAAVIVVWQHRGVGDIPLSRLSRRPDRGAAVIEPAVRHFRQALAARPAERLSAVTGLVFAA
jgi:hypothetical protein